MLENARGQTEQQKALRTRYQKSLKELGQGLQGQPQAPPPSGMVARGM